FYVVRDTPERDDRGQVGSRVRLRLKQARNRGMLPHPQVSGPLVQADERFLDLPEAGLLQPPPFRVHAVDGAYLRNQVRDFVFGAARGGPGADVVDAGQLGAVLDFGDAGFASFPAHGGGETFAGHALAVDGVVEPEVFESGG